MEEFKIEGRWWFRGKEAPALFGILETGENLLLTIPIPQDRSTEQTIFAELSKGSEESLPKIIIGRNAHNRPVTLFGCHALRSSSEGLEKFRIQPIAAVDGLEFSSWDDCSIAAVCMDVEMLASWLADKVVERVDAEVDHPAFRRGRADDIVVSLSPEVTIRITRFVAQSESETEFRLNAAPRVWLHFKTPCSMRDVRDYWSPFVRRFFSMLVGERLHCSIEVYKLDPFEGDGKTFPQAGKLVRDGLKKTNERETLSVFMLASYSTIAAEFSDIVRRWTEVASKLEPVVDLFSIVALSDHSLHSQAQFLFLVQALEVYHARLFDSTALPKGEHQRRVEVIKAAIPEELREWACKRLTANYKYLNERLGEVFQRHNEEAARLFDDLEALPEQIRYTRNYLTHYTDNSDKSRYLDDNAMMRVNFFLRVFLWSAILKEIGAPTSAVDRLIRRHSNVEFVTLD